MKPQEFFNKYKDFAIQAMQKTNVPASVTLAQAALESGWGKHAPKFNFFGIKGEGPAGHQELWTTEHINGRDVRVVQKFRAYRNAEEAFEDHANIISKGPLKSAMKYTSSAVEFITALQRGPYKYATDPGYKEKILQIIKIHGLDFYDKV